MSVYLYAALHISDNGYGSQFRLAVSAESLHIAGYLLGLTISGWRCASTDQPDAQVQVLSGLPGVTGVHLHVSSTVVEAASGVRLQDFQGDGL